MSKKKEVQCWRHRSITSARESNVVVPATKTTERMQTTIQLSNKLINWTHWRVIQKSLIQAKLNLFLNHFHYQTQPGALHVKSQSLLPLLLRIKEFSQRINITGPKLFLCCLTSIFFTCFTIYPSWCTEGRELWENHMLHENGTHGKTPSLSLNGQEMAPQC